MQTENGNGKKCDGNYENDLTHLSNNLKYEPNHILLSFLADVSAYGHLNHLEYWTGSQINQRAGRRVCVFLFSRLLLLMMVFFCTSMRRGSCPCHDKLKFNYKSSNYSTINHNQLFPSESYNKYFKQSLYIIYIGH